MIQTLQTLCLALFIVIMVIPGVYGFHLLVLAILAHRRRDAVRRAQDAQIAAYCGRTPEHAWPHVTTQIPLYNELRVARRVIEAVARLDYPLDRHEIQVLDDSTDDTREVVDQVAAELCARGHDVRVVRRPTREHYKAGALANGLRSAHGQYVAIFDADFVPGRDFLRSLIALLEAEPRAGCVQARWGHLNENASWMTEALAIGMDGHFGVEQGGRGWNGFLFNFNGTAGVWRRAAIEDPRVGGWQGDTITEDLDLSYRAQLAGWRLLFRLDECAPAEIPSEVNALKAQQRRWATGSIQTARKLVPALWRSRDLTLAQKLEGSWHLTQYAVNVFMLLAIAFGRVLLWPVPRSFYAGALAWSWLPCLLAASASWGAYVYGRWAIGGGLIGPLKLLKLIVLGLGLSLNNSVAVLVGLRQRGGEFVRTPKSGESGARPRGSPYAALRSRLWLAELAIGAFCLFQYVWFLRQDGYINGTFLLLYAIGLISLGWASRPASGGGPRAPEPAYAATPSYRHGSEPSAEPAMRAG